MVLIFLEIGERDLEYPTLEGIVRVLQTSGAVHEGLADTTGKIRLGCARLRRVGGESYSRIWKVPGALMLYQSSKAMSESSPWAISKYIAVGRVGNWRALTLCEGVRLLLKTLLSL